MDAEAFVDSSWAAMRSTSCARRLCRCCWCAARKGRINASGLGFGGAIAGRSGAKRLAREPTVKNKALPAVCVLLAGLWHPAMAFADQALAASDNAFAVKLFKQL